MPSLPTDRRVALPPRITGTMGHTREYITMSKFSFTQDLTRDMNIIAAVQDGQTLNAATKAYASWARDLGIGGLQIVSHKPEALADLLSEHGEAAMDVDTVRTAVASIQAAYDVAESTAKDYVRAHLDLFGHEWPVINPREAIFAWFKSEGDTADHAEFITFATETLGRSRSNANEYWKGYELHLHLIG